MNILLLDIETSPNLAYVWGIWEQNVQLNQLVSCSSTLCWAAKWLDEPEIMFDSVHKSSEKQMLKGVHRLLDRADMVVHYNGKKFDVPTLNKEFLLNDMAPPSPYKQVDMLHVAREKFRFQSNKLDYVAKQLGLGSKVSHEGFELWVKCLKGDPEAWKRMEKYNRGDVALLEKVYKKMLPWIPNHPNHGAHDGDIDACPSCGGHHLQRRGFAVTRDAKYARYQCSDCGAWSRGTKAVVRSRATTVGVAA